MDYDERNALFRAHAAAVLTGDDAEADRTHRLIYPDHLMAHQVFVPALFAMCVVDHFGDELDWSRLDAFIGELRSEYPDVSPLKTEALIRVMYGENLLYFEVPVAEHPASMWAVCRLALGGEVAEDELSELFERADDLGRDFIHGVFVSEQLRGWPEPEESR